VAVPVGSWLLSKDLWLPYWFSTPMILLAFPIIILIPETVPGRARSRTNCLRAYNTWSAVFFLQHKCRLGVWMLGALRSWLWERKRLWEVEIDIKRQIIDSWTGSFVLNGDPNVVETLGELVLLLASTTCSVNCSASCRRPASLYLVARLSELPSEPLM